MISVSFVVGWFTCHEMHVTKLKSMLVDSVSQTSECVQKLGEAIVVADEFSKLHRKAIEINGGKDE